MKEREARPGRPGSEAHWVLGFDGSCRTCGEISQAVAVACAGRLEVLPLENPRMKEWRAAAFGPDAPFAPTLIRADEDGRVRAWTSHRMALPLTRRLGVRATLRVLGALGRLREQIHQPLAGPADDTKRFSRKQFLRLGAGATVAGGLLFTGTAPAFAEERRSAAAAWVTANRDRLPQTYQAIIAYSPDYRRAIHAALPASTRARLWREHVASYRAAHPPATSEQQRALADLERYISDDAVFGGDKGDKSDARVRADQEMSRQMIAAFGADEAYRVMASLGPDDQPVPARAEYCSCSDASDFCRVGTHCQYRVSCERIPSGCGAWWDYTCDGHCFRNG